MNRLLEYTKKEQTGRPNTKYVIICKGRKNIIYSTYKDADLAMLRLQCMGYVTILQIKPLTQLGS